MIEYIHFKDFRNLVDVTITPSSFINLIEGENGQGKSSILQGIKYLFTDDLDEKISEYVRWGCDKFYIESKFSFNGNNYKYGIEGSKISKKELVINGVDIYKNSEATRKMNEIIDANIVKYSVIAEQGKNTQILFEKNTERLKHLKEILGIDKLFPLVEEMKEEEKSKEIIVQDCKKEIKLLSERQYNFLDVPELIDIEYIKNEFQLLEKYKEVYELKNKFYEKYLVEKTEYDKAYKIIEENQEFILKYYASLDELDKSQIEYNHTESEEELREQLSKYETEKLNQEHKTEKINSITTYIDRHQKNIDKYNKDLEKYILRRIQECSTTKEDIVKQEQLVLDFEIKQSKYKEELKLARQGKCPTCGKDYIVDIDKLQKEFEDNSQNMLMHRAQLTLLKNQLDNYNKEINEQETIKIQRQNIITMIQSEQAIIEKYKEELKGVIPQEENTFLIDYDSLLKDIKDKLENRRRVQLYNVQISNQIRELENKIKVSQSLIDQYKDIKRPEEIEKPNMYDKEKYDILNKEIIIHEQKVKEKERIEKYNEDIKIEQSKDQIKIKELSTIIDSVSYQIQILKESRQVLDKEFSAYLIDKGASFIKEKMNDFFQRAYGRYEITFNQDKNSIDFFYGDEGSVSPVGMASGFERSLLAIAFRIALASLQNLGLIIFDEVDSDASVDKSLSLYETLLRATDKDTQFFFNATTRK
jgi:DNA repair exonuclease SbcCD ATPase subunit